MCDASRRSCHLPLPFHASIGSWQNRVLPPLSGNSQVLPPGPSLPDHVGSFKGEEQAVKPQSCQCLIFVGSSLPRECSVELPNRSEACKVDFWGAGGEVCACICWTFSEICHFQGTKIPQIVAASSLSTFAIKENLFYI